MLGALKAGAGLVAVGFCVGTGIYLSKKFCTSIETYVLEHSKYMQDKTLGLPGQEAAAQAPTA